MVSAQVADHVTTIPEFLCSDPTKGGPSLGSGSKARAQRPWPALAGPGLFFKSSAEKGGKIIDAARSNQRRWLEESVQRLEKC